MKPKEETIINSYIVGRQNSKTTPDIEIPNNEDTVGRSHIKLQLEAAGKYLIEEIDAKNGTFVKDGNTWSRISSGYVSGEEIIKLGNFITCVDKLLSLVNQNISEKQIEEPTDPGNTKPTYDPVKGKFIS